MEFQRIENKLLDESYRFFVHKSGLKVFYTEKNFRTTYAILGVRFGAANEVVPVNGKPLPTGCAHFLEHKMFENPDGEDTFLKFSRIGANANAYTCHERTCYLFTASKEVEEGLRILLESVFTPYFTDANVRKEKGIIAEEINMYRDDPGDALYKALLGCLYQNDFMKRNICGTVRSIKAISKDDLYTAYRQYYRPDNMVLSICGHCDLKKLEALLDKLLEKQETSSKIDALCLKDEPLFVHRASSRLYRDISTPMAGIGIKIPPFSGDPKEGLARFAQLCLLTQVLFSDSSALSSVLKEKNLIPEDPAHEITDRAAFSHILFFADTYDPTALFREFKKQTDRILKHGIDPKDFTRAKRVLFAEHLEEFNSTEECACRYLDDALDGCEHIDYAKILSELRLEEVNALARAVLKPERICKCRILPYPKQNDS